MKFLLEFVESNMYLFIAIIAFALILVIILRIILINKKNRKSIKEEYEQLTKIEEENEKIENSEEKSEVAFELEQILEKMEQDIEMKPEDIVRQFEDEQEQKAIISYQELLDSVNNNKIEVVEDDEGDIDFVRALEDQLSFANDYIEKVNDTSNIDYNVGIEPVNKSHLDVIDEMNMDYENKSFHTSEILSPVFGRMQPDFEYKVIDSHALSNNKVELEQVAGPTVQDELAANEDFLKALIEFRNNLQ